MTFIRPEGTPISRVSHSLLYVIVTAARLARRKLWLLPCILLLTALVYLPALSNGFTNWDDPAYVTQNPYVKAFTRDNIKALFTRFYANNYQPLTMLSLAIDYRIGGMEPRAYHFTNVLLHVVTTGLVFLLVLLLAENVTVALVVGVLFGVHTLHVESVAWISERKDVLYGLFFVASLVSYVLYVKRGCASRFLMAAILGLSALTSAQCLVWRDDVTLWSRVLTYYPTNRTGLNMRGIARHNLCDYAGAVVDFTKAIELSPYHARTHYNRARSNMSLGRAREAQRDLAIAKKLSGM